MWYINKPKYYGWQSTVIDASWIRPASLDLVQYITNTTTVENELPPVYNLKTSSGRELDVLEGNKSSNAVLSKWLDVWLNSGKFKLSIHQGIWCAN